MARQYYPSALLTYRTRYIYVRPIPCQQGRRFSDCERMSGPADMQSSCESNESAAAERQKRTVHQIRGWKEGQLPTAWNQQHCNIELCTAHRTWADNPLSYRVPVRERYGSTLLPATREQHDQNCTQSH